MNWDVIAAMVCTGIIVWLIGCILSLPIWAIASIFFALWIAFGVWMELRRMK